MADNIEKDSVSGQMTTGLEWDGLKELNTPLPRWWLYTFYACIGFALVWMVLFPALPITGATGLLGWTARGALPAQLAEERARIEPMMARLRAATPEQIAADPELRNFALAGGRIAFANNCAACHGAGGQGAVGGFPSLADDDWIYGGTFDAIQHTIRHGVRSNESDEQRGVAMPAFLGTGMLTPPQINDTAEFVLSLTNRSTDPAPLAFAFWRIATAVSASSEGLCPPPPAVWSRFVLGSCLIETLCGSEGPELSSARRFRTPQRIPLTP